MIIIIKIPCFCIMCYNYFLCTLQWFDRVHKPGYKPPYASVLCRYRRKRYHSERHSDNPGSIYWLGLKRQGITRELSRLRRKKDLYKSGTLRGFWKGGGGMCNRNLDNRKNIKITIIFAKRIFLGAGELMLGGSSTNMLQNCVGGEGRTVFFKNLRKMPPPPFEC